MIRTGYRIEALLSECASHYPALVILFEHQYVTDVFANATCDKFMHSLGTHLVRALCRPLSNLVSTQRIPRVDLPGDVRVY
jgi:hypothetical protein